MRWGKAIDGWTDWMIAKGNGERTIYQRRGQLRLVAAAHLHRNPWKVTGNELVGWMARQDWSPGNVPLHPTLEVELTAERDRRDASTFGTGWRYRVDAGGPWLFPNPAGDGPMTGHAVTAAASKALGGQWSTHSLRHRAATRAYAGTRDLLALQDLLGHSKPETSRVYTRLPDGALAAAVNAI